MNRPQALSALRSLLPSIVSSGDPSGTLIKAAEERGWSPEQLQHVGQLYNTAKQVTYMDKVAQELRGAQHTILDVPAMVTKFASTPVKTAAPSHSADMDWFEVPVEMDKAAAATGDRDEDWFEDSPQEKQASSKTIPNFMSQISEGDPLEKAASAPVPAYRESDICERTRLNEELRIKEARAQEMQLLDDYTWEQIEILNNEMTKFAKSRLFDVADEIEHDMKVVMDPVKVACVVRALEGFCETTGRRLKRASNEPQGMVFDRHAAQDSYEAIWNAASRLETAEQMKAAAYDTRDRRSYTTREREMDRKFHDEEGRRVVKKAPPKAPPENVTETDKPQGKKTQENKTQPKSTSKAEGKSPSEGKTTPKKEEKKESPKGQSSDAAAQGVNTALDLAQSGVTGIRDFAGAGGQALSQHNKQVQEVVDALKPETNEHQRAVDQGTQEALAEATLQQLMAQDEVIASADPATVERLYTALVTEEPALASNPEALGIALREAIQYNGVPSHMMTELGKHRKTRLESEALEANQEKREYANS